MPRLGFDRVPFVLPPLLAMDSALRPTSGITYDGALPRASTVAAEDADIELEADEAPGIPMASAFKHFDRIK